jgi:hypothetical protein
MLFQVFYLYIGYILLLLYTHVLNVCFKCFRCFTLILLQVFYMDVTKVDLDITYIAMTIQYTHMLSVSFECFNRSGIAHIAMAPVANGHWLVVAVCERCRGSPCGVDASKRLAARIRRWGR